MALPPANVDFGLGDVTGGVGGLKNILTGGGVSPTAPISLVNFLASTFGNRADFGKSFARLILNNAVPLMQRQQKILSKAGGKDSDIYNKLESSIQELNRLAGLGDAGFEGIFNMQPQLVNIVTHAQNIIQPIPGDFSFNPAEAGIHARTPTNKLTEPFTRINQFLDKAEGIATPLTQNIPTQGAGRLPGGRPKKTLGQGYFVEPPQGQGEGLRRARQGGAAPQAVFKSVSPLDITLVSERLSKFGNVSQPASQGDGQGSGGLGIKDIARIGLQFLKPRGIEFGSTTGFPSSARGGLATSFEAEKDLLVPTGFISKQQTRLPLSGRGRTAGTVLEGLL
jgi:hypothetical protein